MGYIVNTLTAIATTVLGRQIYDSGPHLSRWLIRIAASRLLTAPERKLREEEWLAHLNDSPGISGFYHAAGSLLASYRMVLPFETIAIRYAIWFAYYGLEQLLDFGIMKPYMKKTLVASATKEEVEVAMDFVYKLAAQKIILRLVRRHLPHMDVDRDMLWHTLSAFNPKASART